MAKSEVRFYCFAPGCFMNSAPDKLSLYDRLHYLHRFWRYRFRTEPDTVQFIEEEYEPGGVALDIGANKGIVTYFLGKQAGPSGKVIAFEPQPEMGNQIRRVARTFGLSNIEVHSIGLSEKDETVTLYRGNAGQTANMVASGSWQHEEIEVESRSLDSFVESHSIEGIDFVKCDVDGYEMQVLKGATGVLEKFSPKVLIEISEDKFTGIANLLKENGYDDGIFWFKGKRYPASESNSVPFRHPTAKWRNYLFCKES